MIIQPPQNGRPGKRRGRCALAMLMAAATGPGLWCVASAQATVKVESIRVGFKGRHGGDDFHQGIVRLGDWIPVAVDLSIVNQSRFDGTVRVGQFDSDGDAAYDSVEVHLLEPARVYQRYWLYILPSPSMGRIRLTVEVLDQDDRAVTVEYNGKPHRTVQPEDAPVVMEDRHMFVLDISQGGATGVMELGDAAYRGTFLRDVYVGKLDAADLPEHWIGLEMVDAIVWDQADPNRLKTPAQLEGLVEWVRQGGTLLVAAARTADAVAQAQALNDILPVDIGAVASTQRLGQLPYRMFGADRPPAARDGPGGASGAGGSTESPALALRRRISYVTCTPRPDPSVFVYYEDADTPEFNALISRRQVGRGHVVFCGVAINDILKQVPGLHRTETIELGVDDVQIRPSSAVEFYRRVFFLRSAQDADQYGTVPVFPYVQSAVSFQRNTGMYLLITFMFVLVYFLLATFVSWRFLKARGWERHSWSAFAVVAGVASVLSVMVVQAARGGFGQRIEQVSVVDVVAGSRSAVGTAFFGLKTAMHTELDVWLASDFQMEESPVASECTLRPAPESNLPGSDVSSTYADPSAYRLVPTRALLEGVPFRATLKKLHGRWRGGINGFVDGRVVILPPRQQRELGTLFAPGSTLTNQLGVDLEQCYLLYAETDLYLRRTGALTGALRDGDTYALPLGRFQANSTINLVERCTYVKPAAVGTGKGLEALRKYRLVEEQKRWRLSLASVLQTLNTQRPAGSIDMGLDMSQSALMLASTISDRLIPELDRRQRAWGMGTVTDISRDHLRELDLHASLRPDMLILIGFARDAGPIRLKTRTTGSSRAFSTVTPDSDASFTMYRILIPIDRPVIGSKAAAGPVGDTRMKAAETDAP